MANNYMMQAVNPTQAITQAMQTVQGVRDMRATRDARQLAQEQVLAQAQAAEAQAAEQARIQAEFSAALKAAHENPTAENRLKLADLYAMYSPEKAKALKENWNTYTADRQQVILRDSVNTLAALETNPAFGLKMLQEQAEAAKNAGDMEEAKRYQTLVDMINVGPMGLQSVNDFLTMTIGMMPGGDKAIEGVAKLGEEKRAAAAEPTVQKKRLADIGFTDAQTNKVLAETRKLGLEADQLTSEIEAAKNALPAGPELSEGAKKIVNDSVIAAAKANTLSKQYTTLATDFESAITTAGTSAKISEQIARLLGTEKEPTALRQEFLRMRNTAVLEMLPPGVASDKDIEIALAAFPTETSSPANISSFLRGMSKLQAYEASVNSAKAEWIQQNGTLGTASAPMTVGNRQVEKGDRFTEFIEAYVPNTSVLGAGGASGASFGAVPSNETGAVDLNALRAFLINKWPKEKDKINSLSLEQMALPENYPRGLEEFKQLQGTGTQAPVVEVVEMDDL